MCQTAQKLETSFEVGEAPRVSIDIPDGSLSVVPGPEGTVKILVRERDAEEFEDGEPLICTQEGNLIRIRWNEEVGESDLDLQVTVPRRSTVEASTHDGEISVHGLEGEVRVESGEGEVSAHDLRGAVFIESQSGEVNVHDLTGEMVIECVDGDLTAHDLAGALRLDCANGDVRIVRSQLSRLWLEAPNGEAEVETSLAEGGEYRLAVTNGDTRLSIPGASQATIWLRTENGEVHCGLPAEVTLSKKKQWEGRLNGGGATVSVESSNGDIRVVASGAGLARPAAHTMPEAAMPPMPPMEPMSPIEPLSPTEPFSPLEPFSTADSPEAATPGVGHNEATIEVLARLERGEITVEEAMSSLDRLG